MTRVFKRYRTIPPRKGRLCVCCSYQTFDYTNCFPVRAFFFFLFSFANRYLSITQYTHKIPTSIDQLLEHGARQPTSSQKIFYSKGRTAKFPLRAIHLCLFAISMQTSLFQLRNRYTSAGRGGRNRYRNRWQAEPRLLISCIPGGHGLE